MQNSCSCKSSWLYSSSKLMLALLLLFWDTRAKDVPFYIICAFLCPNKYSGSSNSLYVGPKFLKPEPHSALLNWPPFELFLWDSIYFSIWSKDVKPFDLKNFNYSITSLKSLSFIKLLTIFWWSSSELNLANIFIELIISLSSFDLFLSNF